MNSQIKISVIIPIYNGQIHIENCLNTVTKQNFKKNFEILMINDGSTDKSLEIIKKYKTYYKKNIKIFSLPKNLGVSAARNLGIRKAKGEYLYFLDVDDTIENSALDTLYYTAKKKKIVTMFVQILKELKN